ncbi:DUF1194 domain-containing protein [Dongia sp.]|uniref:DUF1194 domain-containing protein n=1 Tax=Dongia sp. TaxID=1977262 RepID=UPI0037500D06
MRALSLFLAACGLVLCGAASAQDRPPVDVALVLVVDASGSIDTEEFVLQRDGIAGAVTDGEVLGAIMGGRHGKIAISLVEWGSPGGATKVVDWRIVGDAGSAGAFADAVRSAPRAMQSYNAIGDGMVLATALIDACLCDPTRRVIDVSGDNPDMRSNLSAPIARDLAVKAGITVNALAILQDDRVGPGGKPWLVEVYEQTVIGGFGAFVIPARTRADFARALRQKLIQEIASL